MSDLLTQMQADMPIAFQAFDPAARPTGLVIVDIVNGFATPGAGPLAPPGPDAMVSAMIGHADGLARRFSAQAWPVLAFLDSHQPGKPEPPYPPHCEMGSGQENLVPQLSWLENDAQTTLIRKDCINGFVGAMTGDGRNAVVDWVNRHHLGAVLVLGICTDICVMDFVLTLLSARNHGLMPALADIAVFAPGCATYDLPGPVATSLGLPPTAAHPALPAHHMGLYFMASRGAILTDRLA